MSYYQIGIYEKAFPEELSLSSMLKIAKEVGFGYFEMSIDRTDDRIHRLYDRGFWENCKTAIEESGVPISSICLSALSTYTMGNKDTEEKAKELFIKTCDFADKIGARIIQIPACDVKKGELHTKESDERFLNNIKTIIPYAASKAIIVGFENMEDDYMNTVSKMTRIIDQVNSPYFRLYPDIGNITGAYFKREIANLENESVDPTNDLYEEGEYVALHVKEVKHDRFGGLFYGQGCVDFKKFIDKALQLGIRRFTMEYWYTGNKEWENDLNTAFNLCNTWIQHSGVKLDGF